MYSVLCKNTGHGDIPGKGDGKKAWYCWGGREMESNNFQFVVVKPVPAPPPPYYPPQPSFQPGYYPPQPEYAPQPSYPGYAPQPSYPGGYAPDPAPHHAAAPSFGFSEGMLVRLQCNKTNKNLRIMGCGRVCGFGGRSTATSPPPWLAKHVTHRDGAVCNVPGARSRLRALHLHQPGREGAD